MANPQIENGHIDIANELAEVFMKINLSGYQHRIIWCIFRKTYGWHKDKDKISLTQFEKMTGLRRRNLHRALRELEDINMIIIDRNSYINTYKFNADYDTWKLKISIKSDTTPVSNIIPKLVSNPIHTKEKKENKQKKPLSSKEKYNYAIGMNAEREWKGKKEKPEIIKKKFVITDKFLKEAGICFKEFGSDCNVRLSTNINDKCRACLLSRKKLKDKVEKLKKKWTAPVNR